MGNLPSPKPAPILSLAQKQQSARLILSRATGRKEAAEAAARLIGSYANLRPADPAAFAAAIAAVLEQYPLGLVDEACDPRRGAARDIRWLGVAELVEWLDSRLATYRAYASVRLATGQREASQEECRIGSRALAKLWLWLKQDKGTRGAPPTWQQAKEDVR